MAKKTATRKSAATKPRARKRPTPAEPAASATPTPRPTAAAQTPPTPKTGHATRMTCLDAAHAVLVRINRPLRVRELIEQMADRDLWQSPAGATPESTVTSAIIREMKKRGSESRFQRVDRGFYAASSWQSP